MPLRELVARLGFEADLTEANRFDKKIDSTKRNIEGLNQVSLAGFAGVVNKAFAVLGGVATGGAFIAFQRFADLERSLEALRGATKGSFAPLKKEIDSIVKSGVLKNLVSEIDLVNAALFEAQEKGVEGQDLTKFIRLAALLSVQTKKSVSETLGLITGFVVDGDLGILKLLQELPPQLQEIFKVAGIGPGQAGLIGRREKVLQSLLKAVPELEESIFKLREKGVLEQEKLSGAFDKLVLEVGERTVPAFKSLNDELIPFIEKVTRFTRGEVGIEEIAPVTPAAASKVFKDVQVGGISKLLEEFPGFFESLFDFADFTLPSLGRANEAIGAINQEQRQQQINVAQPAIQIPFAPQPGANNSNVTVTNNVTVQSGATADPGMIRLELDKVNRQTWGAIQDQAKRTTIRRGGQ